MPPAHLGGALTARRECRPNRFGFPSALTANLCASCFFPRHRGLRAHFLKETGVMRRILPVTVRKSPRGITGAYVGAGAR
ncbi:hypothetical protein BBSC_2289 [Bifidobacterium scardovii JCM 12489 = DSM 13734]|nr:hypothetical protein BBSC_2289 [Bifidobacterium scardovii JCM 12489 = DSM 13734]